MLDFISRNSLLFAYILIGLLLVVILIFLTKVIRKIAKVIQTRRNRKLLHNYLVSKAYFDRILDYLEVLFNTDELHVLKQCSKQILSNFQTYKKFDYLVKYFGLVVNDDTVENLNNLKIYLNDIYKELQEHNEEVIEMFESEFLPSFTACYNSAGGRVNDDYTFVLDIDSINFLIDSIEGKMLKYPKYIRERNRITEEIRDSILHRDNFTCKICGNSQYNEPNLLLEVDHILPISKGGKTEPNNLQTLCWRCNRKKSNSI